MSGRSGFEKDISDYLALLLHSSTGGKRMGKHHRWFVAVNFVQVRDLLSCGQFDRKA
jgi:hypothetical protein